MDERKYEVVVKTSKDGRKVLSEEWYLDNLMSRLQDLPAKQEFDSETGIVVREEYWIAGYPHRPHGPAIIVRSPETGEVILEEFYCGGLRVDGPIPRPPTP
jgi:hypothetical protein